MPEVQPELPLIHSTFSKPCSRSGPLGLAEHVGLRVDSDGVLEERRELEQKDAGAAAKVEQPTAAAAAELPEASDELSRIRPTVSRVEARGIPRERPILVPGAVRPHGRNLDRPSLRGHSRTLAHPRGCFRGRP